MKYKIINKNDTVNNLRNQQIAIQGSGFVQKPSDQTHIAYCILHISATVRSIS